MNKNIKSWWIYICGERVICSMFPHKSYVKGHFTKVYSIKHCGASEQISGWVTIVYYIPQMSQNGRQLSRARIWKRIYVFSSVCNARWRTSSLLAINSDCFCYSQDRWETESLAHEAARKVVTHIDTTAEMSYCNLNFLDNFEVQIDSERLRIINI